MTRSVYSCEFALVGDRVLADVVIAVDHGRFVSVAPGSPNSGATRLAGLTTPGLANAHSHAFHRALRSRTQTGNGSFWAWRDLMYRAAQRLDPDGYHRLARATYAEMALAGVTVVGEFHYVHHQPGGARYDNPNAMGEAMLAAAAEAGIRITLLDTLYLHGGLDADGYTPTEGPQRRYDDTTAQEWAGRVERLQPADGQLIGAAIHSVRAVDPASMRIAAAWTAGREMPFHSHVSEQVAENEQCLEHHNMTPTQLLHECGAINGRFSAVHATHVTNEDIATFGSTGSTVCLCPTTERDLGDGIGPTIGLAEAAVPMALGSDSHAMIDMFEEARAVELNERLRSQRRGLHSTSELIAMATHNGHRSLGWSDAGTITTGARADLVTLSLDSVRTAGTTIESAAEAIVFAASAADVTHVVVDGRTIVADRQHTSIDVAAELRSTISELMEP